ncbi:hypothetical protein MN086_06120 [Sulfurovum sp. XGS-02]|uniref:multiheme c-type cytochrome n=1 Tax=Sulfurovum sp. XGS-02 TaxID=2925411 RepID=UPI00205D40DE|nr:multiheme c-type cytochrome [Sulfurovum sp. XGS-02]UPT76630.1 hypothetical protein MN086_06120 [Sulfurovum sp. XGS-02]
MKLNVKSLMLVLGTGIMFSLSGCGGGSSTSTVTTDSAPATEITYTGTDGSTRTAAINPGDAEVLAGQGYQHTLFDTAVDKCQHCHNELFDSWKTSMHSKSWSDKIFQSKHQDFLRTHIAKIGAQNIADDVNYTTGTLGKVGKTCAKCHAPAAIYSNDYNLTVSEITGVNYTDLNKTEWASLKDALENNTVSDALGNPNPSYTPHEPTTVVSIGKDKKLYSATYHIGHENNREGISCATCHSIETVRMMTDETYIKDGVVGTGGDGGIYTLAADMRGNVIGPIVQEAINPLGYSPDASERDMNIFFKLVGPEKYADVANSPHETSEYDVNKKADGRYTFRGIDEDNSTNGGKTHYTGGPFYGPFGVTGLDNSNADDDTNRSAQVNPYYDKEENNHFGNNGKALCLSCHQRSAGAIVPGTNPAEFMELCTTWTAVSNGDDTNANDSVYSPKCQKCHMPRVDEEFVLHQWAKPTTLFTQEFMAANNKTALTPSFDPDDMTAIDNPVRDKWMNDHAFVGGNKLGAPNSGAKFQSGFDSSLIVEDKGNGGLQVKTVLRNKTAHMFPGAHPMRRVLTRVIVTDSNGVEQNVSIAHATSKYGDISNNVVTGDATDTISEHGDAVVDVWYNSDRVISYQGKADELVNTEVYSQDFNGSKPILIGVDGTVKNQIVTDTNVIKGNVFNAAIIDLTEYDSRFTRIYGRQTGKYFDLTTGAPTSPSTPGAAYIVRPGFDSNIVPDQYDNRLQPNEREEYTINYNGLAAGDYSVTFKVYYMLKGANGQFPEAQDGWLDPVVNEAKKFIIREMDSHTETVTVTDAPI